ncbi:MAG: hypothetical protein AAFO91_03090 [Bacteroidota bacterium]
MTLTAAELHEKLQPENPLEASFLQDEEFVRGLNWGKPRYGHPEGSIWRHILELNANVDRLPTKWLAAPAGPGSKLSTRESLRITTWVHDTFKHIEDKSTPRDWSRHHAVYGRKFLERYLDDQWLLDLVELHDEAYYAWRLLHLMHRRSEGEKRLKALRERMGDFWQLYYLFFKCDTCTGDKNPAPLIWFESEIGDIEVVNFRDTGA